MRSFFEWFRDLRDDGRSWLILGKGPTFACRHEYALEQFHLLSLNHAVREQPVLVAHMIDLDVVRACADILEQRANVVAMPWYPHVRNKVGDRNLAELVPTIPVLTRLAAAGRLVWYDLSTARRRHGAGPVVRATYFSSEAALSLLALAGVRRVRSLGVDGGASYSPDFHDLADQTLLANGQTTFDLQFQGIARTIVETGVDFAPLDLASPLRVYIVGGAPEEALAVEVLEHSIRRRTSLWVDVQAVPDGGAVPPAGPALLLSPRLQCFADLRQLRVAAPPDDEVVIPAPGPSAAPVRLALVGSAGTHAGALALRLCGGVSAAELGGAGLPVRARLHPDWRPAERYRPGRTRFLFFAADGTEPWLSRAHPLGHLWAGDLIDAVKCGAISLQRVSTEVRRGHVRPSLLYQAEHGAEEALLLPRRARIPDYGFHMPGARAEVTLAPATGAVHLLAALARASYRRARGMRTAWRAASVASG